jgi:hypothetical protein
VSPRPPDFLQFEGGVVAELDAGVRLSHFPGRPLQDNGAYRREWAGDWPPPERMAIAVGGTTGYVSVFNPDDLPNDVDLEVVSKVATVTIYRRVSASELPEDETLTHVMRGALYQPED